MRPERITEHMTWRNAWATSALAAFLLLFSIFSITVTAVSPSGNPAGRTMHLLASWGNAALGDIGWILPVTITVAFALAAFCAAESRYADDDDDFSTRQVYAALGSVIAGVILAWMALTILTALLWVRHPATYRPSHGVAATTLFLLGIVGAIVATSAGRFWWMPLDKQLAYAKRARSRNLIDLEHIAAQLLLGLHLDDLPSPQGSRRADARRLGAAYAQIWCVAIVGFTVLIAGLLLMARAFPMGSDTWRNFIVILAILYALSACGAALTTAARVLPPRAQARVDAMHQAQESPARPADRSARTTPSKLAGVAGWLLLGISLILQASLLTAAAYSSAPHLAWASVATIAVSVFEGGCFIYVPRLVIKPWTTVVYLHRLTAQSRIELSILSLEAQLRARATREEVFL